MSEDYSLERFSKLVGEKFLIQGLPISEQELLLNQVVLQENSEKMETFSLFFLGPQQPVLPQATYRIFNTSIGEMDIFLVPVGKTADGIQYEAVFNHLKSL